jgi:hypothetical protein
MARPALDILDDVPCHAAGCAGIVLMLWNCDRHDLPFDLLRLTRQ